ncbi:CaiB/BaiF CoA transferase family protein [Oricola sp.]|uniref:CaiB/BaiF CoA transferase family protein n=1 Tax=Oricola sp. TaxID=1979950 RepID=UPI003BAA5175
MAGVLKGLKVLDFSTLLPGPMATLFLTESGAEVVKVERPGRGEDMRSYPPFFGTSGSNFALLNRGKKSLALDLKDPAAVNAILPLAAEADVIVEQFRPGVMDRLGLGYEAVRAANPDIIYCSITGYGQTGPGHLRAGHDLNYISETGLLALGLGTKDVPTIPPALIGDIAGGTYPAIFNILLALIHRDRTGEGAHLDISMSDNLFPFAYWAIGQGEVTGDWPGSGDGLITGGSPRYRLYPTVDGRFAAVAALEQKFWMTFCEAIGLDDALRNDAAEPEATAAGVAAIIAARPAAHWETVFDTADCCCTVVRTLSEAMRSKHFRTRGLFDARVASPDGAEITAMPVPVARQFRADADGVRPYPELGQNNDDLLSDRDV